MSSLHRASNTSFCANCSSRLRKGFEYRTFALKSAFTGLGIVLFEIFRVGR